MSKLEILKVGGLIVTVSGGLSHGYYHKSKGGDTTRISVRTFNSLYGKHLEVIRKCINDNDIPLDFIPTLGDTDALKTYYKVITQ